MSTKFYTADEILGSIREGLGDWVDEYDVDAIFDAAYKYEIITEEYKGGLRVVAEGYQIKPEYSDETVEGEGNFWEMVEEYHVASEDEETEPQDEPAPQLQNPFLDMMNAKILPSQK